MVGFLIKLRKKWQCFWAEDSHVGPFTEVDYMAYRCEHCGDEFDIYV